MDGQSDYAALLTIFLLRSALPFIKPGKGPSPTHSTSDSQTIFDLAHLDRDSQATPAAVLSHLCELLDTGEREGEGEGEGGRKGVDAAVQRLAQEIVVEGVVVFFPDAAARKEHLLSMIGSVLGEEQPRSWWLRFEALCQYFSRADVNSLLSLPEDVQEV